MRAAVRGALSAAILLTLIAGCQSQTGADDAGAPADTERRVECRTGGSGPMRPDCTLEWRGKDNAGRQVLVIRKADGGFRRLLLGADGRLGQADGAEPLRLIKEQGLVSEMAIGQDVFRVTRQQLDPPQ